MYFVPGKLVIVLLAILVLHACQSEKQQTAKNVPQSPNIIYILADDLGYGDLGCYGQNLVRTPQIDQLAAEGMLFTQHYAGNTVCAPSRAALLTGKHTGHVAVRGNRLTGDDLLPDSEATLASVLKKAGYVTGIIGKWGIGYNPPLDDPLKKGFDYAYGYINMWHAHNFYPDFLVENGKKISIDGNIMYENPIKNSYQPDNPQQGAGWAKERAQYSHDLFEQKAMDFINTNQDTSFMLYLALTIPHANNEGGDQGMEVPGYGIYTEKDWPEAEKGFAAMVAKMDSTVGKIKQQLIDLGISENTLLIFTSDNGPHQEGGHSPDYFQSNGQLQGIKRDLYEGGIRVPMIAWWPGTIEAGTQSDHVSAFWDVLPTFCEIAGAEVPETADGISFVPTLSGDAEKQGIHEYLYWEFYEGGGKQAVRSGDWKLIRLMVSDSTKMITELYNLQNDLDEQNDVSTEFPEIVEKLNQYIDEAHVPIPGHSIYTNREDKAIF